MSTAVDHCHGSSERSWIYRSSHSITQRPRRWGYLTLHESRDTLLDQTDRLHPGH
jgi:hypothetical protein